MIGFVVALYHKAKTVDSHRLPMHHPPMEPIKTMTIRLSADQSEELGTIAAVDGSPVSHVIRSAIARHIEVRKRDAAFQEMLRQRIERAQRMLPSDKK